MPAARAEDAYFPIIGGKLEDGKIVKLNVYGTASYLNNGIFITAAHCIKNAQQDDCVCIITDLANPIKPRSELRQAIEVELFEEFDIGLIRVGSKDLNTTAFNWSTQPGFILEDVYSIGFPHGFDVETKELTTRGLKGYIVAQAFSRRFTGKPHVYELSFHCPRGISGAPLSSAGALIRGFIVANELVELQVFFEREVNKEDGKETVYEKTETTKYGIAIHVFNLLPLKSKILGSTFFEYLQKEKLLR